MHKKKTFSVKDMHLYSQYSLMKTKVDVLPPSACVDLTDGHEGRRVQVTTVILFSVHKAVAAAAAFAWIE